MGKKVQERRILGIDPGTTVMGYGIIEGKGNNATLIDLNIVSMRKISDPMEKLKQIFEQTIAIIEKYLPDEMAVEAPFYGKNVQSMLKLGRAQGVVIAAAMYKNIPIAEYSPRKIKQSITGKGSASKEQVAAALKYVMKSDEPLPKQLDATDAVAVALCHFFQNPALGQGKSYSGWDSFVKQNPDKIK
ncbi:MAG: crossover junction endodeoxyribonuclease RuvC [Cryomorphaceae bacterium]|nr:crossover junction endodeoxyribonuclease RuvC [Cryomorphaceae bacterium]